MPLPVLITWKNTPMVTEPDLRICPGLRDALKLLSADSYSTATVSSIDFVAQRSFWLDARTVLLVLETVGVIAGCLALAWLTVGRAHKSASPRMSSASEI